MPKKRTPIPTETETPSETSHTDLVKALVTAIESTKPVLKKTAATAVIRTPWTPKNGERRLTLKRKMYQHGIQITDRVTNEEIDLLNRIRPGVFLDGHVRVTRRKDKGIDIDYPIKTTAQRLKLVNQFGIRNFPEFLQRLIDEANAPKKPEVDEDGYAV